MVFVIKLILIFVHIFLFAFQMIEYFEFILNIFHRAKTLKKEIIPFHFSKQVGRRYLTEYGRGMKYSPAGLKLKSLKQFRGKSTLQERNHLK